MSPLEKAHTILVALPQFWPWAVVGAGVLAWQTIERVHHVWVRTDPHRIAAAIQRRADEAQADSEVRGRLDLEFASDADVRQLLNELGRRVPRQRDRRSDRP